MGSRRNTRKKGIYTSKRAKSQRVRRQREKKLKIKDCIDVQEVTSLPVTEAAFSTNNVIISNNVPLGQQNAIFPVTPNFGFPTPTAGIQSNGIFVLLNRPPQIVLPSPTILAVPQQNNTVVEGLLAAKHQHQPTPIQNPSTTPNVGVAFARERPIAPKKDATVLKEVSVSSKNDLDLIKENLISKGTEIKIIESSIPAKTSNLRTKKNLVSSKKVASLSVKEISSTESGNLVPVEKSRNRQTCCIIGCGQQRTSNGPSIHAFPKRVDLLTKWLDSIGNRSPSPTLRTNPVICGQHFEQSCFVKSYNRKAFKTLKPGSVPTIFPPHSNATASTTGNENSSLVYDCQIKVEPVDVAEPSASECLKAAKLPETSAVEVSSAERIDWDFTLKDMESPEKAKLYFLKVQKELVLQKLPQNQPTILCEPQTVKVKQEIVINSDDEGEKSGEKQQKMKPRSTSFQQEKWKATCDKPTPEQDEFDAFSVTVAAKLRKMDSKQRMFAENMINQILYKGLMNQLSAVTQTTENLPNPPVQSQTVSPNVQPQQLSSIQQSQLQPLFALNINPPQIQGTVPFQSQATFQNTLQESTFSTILPSRTLGQFATTHFSDAPVISNFAPWRPGSSTL